MKNSESQTITFGEVKLSYQRKQTKSFPSIKSSYDANTVIRKVFPEEQINYREHIYALYLNQSNNVIGYHLVSIGGINNAMIDIRILLQGILLCNGVGVILCHNHPSGNLKPSIADKRLTEKVKSACKLVDIQLLDHIIVTDTKYYSFADEGDL